jgi:DNA repair photolyase
VQELLANRLSRARTLLPDVVAISGSCDPYQPAEEKFENTRKCLEVLAKHKYPVIIGTKATLVTRDIDILERIGKSSWCAVFITITTTDNELSAFLEPNAPMPAERFETVKELKKNGNIQVGVCLMPIVPFLTDSDPQLEAMTKEIKAAGADYILFAAGMTMRNNQANWYLTRLKNKYPELVKKYLALYNAKISPGIGYNGNYGPNRSYTKQINQKMLELCEKYDLKYRIKRFIPDDFRKQNYMIAEEILNEAYNNQISGRPWKNLFWAGQNINNLKEPIAKIADRGELQTIRNIDAPLEQRIEKMLGPRMKQSVLA